MALSADLYGDLGGRDLPAKDTREPTPRSPRGLAEHAALGYLAAYRAEHALEFCGLTLASVYGTRRVDGVVASFARALVAGEPGRMNGNGSTTRDFVAGSTSLRAFYRAPESGNGTFRDAGAASRLYRGVARVDGSGVGVRRRRCIRRPPTAPWQVLDPLRANPPSGASLRPSASRPEVLRWWRPTLRVAPYPPARRRRRANFRHYRPVSWFMRRSPGGRSARRGRSSPQPRRVDARGRRPGCRLCITTRRPTRSRRRSLPL